MKYILLILCLALVGCEKKTDLNKAVVAVNNQQNEKIDKEFLIVKSEGISSKFNANHYVRICEHLPMSELKKRFQNYNVYLHKESPVHEYAKIKNEYFDINIWLDDKNKVKFIEEPEDEEVDEELVSSLSNSSNNSSGYLTVNGKKTEENVDGNHSDSLVDKKDIKKAEDLYDELESIIQAGKTKRPSTRETDMFGKKILSNENYFSGNNINLKSISKGLYLAKVVYNQTTETLKFIVK